MSAVSSQEPIIPENVFRQEGRRRRTAAPCTVVIFGASGDLTRRKLVPALYNLTVEQLLGAGCSLVGYARREKSHAQFREEMHGAIQAFSRRKPDPAIWSGLEQGIYYCQGSFEDLEHYRQLKAMLDGLDRERGTGGNRLFYLATPPSYYAQIVRLLGESGLAEEMPGSWSRIIVEKPFGHDLESAHALNGEIGDVFQEEQIYRIDHYLGKETVQNILAFRLGNAIFEPLWNNRFVDHVELTVAESLGMEGRGAYFDEAGILRDMVQNHIFQVLTLVAMEPPVTLEADEVRDEKVKVLKSIRLLSPTEIYRSVVRAQYLGGAVAGKPARGFLDEPNIPPDSRTETYVAIRLELESWRWAGVPFYIRTGKRLPRRVTEVSIHFKHPPYALFQSESSSSPSANVMVLRIQPDEGMSLTFNSKAPGQIMRLDPVRMDFNYATSFGAEPSEAYERLLLDCMIGDSTLFTRRDEVELSWRYITSILEAWRRPDAPGLATYEAGTWGPAEGDLLLHRDGRRWRRL